MYFPPPHNLTRPGTIEKFFRSSLFHRFHIGRIDPLDCGVHVVDRFIQLVQMFLHFVMVQLEKRTNFPVLFCLKSSRSFVIADRDTVTLRTKDFLRRRTNEQTAFKKLSRRYEVST